MVTVVISTIDLVPPKKGKKRRGKERRKTEKKKNYPNQAHKTESREEEKKKGWGWFFRKSRLFMTFPLLPLCPIRPLSPFFWLFHLFYFVPMLASPFCRRSPCRIHPSQFFCVHPYKIQFLINFLRSFCFVHFPPFSLPAFVKIGLYQKSRHRLAFFPLITVDNTPISPKCRGVFWGKTFSYYTIPSHPKSTQEKEKKKEERKGVIKK